VTVTRRVLQLSQGSSAGPWATYSAGLGLLSIQLGCSQPGCLQVAGLCHRFCVHWWGTCTCGCTAVLQPVPLSMLVHRSGCAYSDHTCSSGMRFVANLACGRNGACLHPFRKWLCRICVQGCQRVGTPCTGRAGQQPAISCWCCSCHLCFAICVFAIQNLTFSLGQGSNSSVTSLEAFVVQCTGVWGLSVQGVLFTSMLGHAVPRRSSLSGLCQVLRAAGAGSA
jgi:hypothetical protein